MASNTLNSGIYSGKVRHRRFTPVQHQFRYQLTMAYLDLSELAQLEKQVMGFGMRIWHLARFRRADYVAGNPDLAQAVQDKVYALTGIAITGNVTMLCHLRYCGLYFSPLNLYYLHDEHGEWCYTLAEVSNTPWNERHYYAVPAPQAWEGREYHHPKAFHVSPFNPMTQTYHWRLSQPDSNLRVNLAVSGTQDSKLPSGYLAENKKCHQKVFDATIQMKKQPFSSSAVIRQYLLTPWITLKVIGGIYWQALKLWKKGAPIYDHPNKALSKTQTKPIIKTRE